MTERRDEVMDHLDAAVASLRREVDEIGRLVEQVRAERARMDEANVLRLEDHRKNGGRE